MSELVDKRVVQMEFDNKQFEKNIGKSINSINNLKQSLNFKGTAEALNNALGNIDTSFTERNLEMLGKKFTTLEVIGVTAISRITNKIMAMGERLIKSLSIDNVFAGWDKFAEKTISVGTLMAQDIKVAGALVSESNKLSVVNDQLSKLLFFTDETSYNFTDMVSNIGKFTAAGQSLDDSVEAMMGIANWAALSGQNAMTASRAMYQLSQAMAVGVIRKEDYKSIQTANMDTVEFKNTVMEAAAAAGYLSKQVDGTYKTTEKAAKAGMEVNATNFASTLTEGAWFTSDVLMSALKKYSSVVDKLYDDVENKGVYDSATEAIIAYKEELKELEDQINNTIDVEERLRLQEEYDTKAFQIKAMSAAQEARTFTDVINATKDAVASGWMTTFEKIFGNYEEAKTLWSEMAMSFWDIFASGGTERNKLLQDWYDLGGRDNLFLRDLENPENQGALWNLLDSLQSIINTLKDSWNKVFGLSGESLFNFTKSIQQLTVKLKPSEKMLERIGSISKGIFSIFKLGAQAIKGIYIALTPVANVAKKTINVLGEVFGIFSEDISAFTEKTNIFVVAGKKVASIFEFLFSKINKVVVGLTGKNPGELIMSIAMKIHDAFTYITKTFRSAKSVDTSSVGEFAENVEGELKPLDIFLRGFHSLLLGVTSVFKAIAPVLGTLIDYIGNLLNLVGTKLREVFLGKNSLQTIQNIFSMFLTGTVITQLWWFVEQMRIIIGSVNDILGGLADVLDSKAAEQYTNALKNTAVSILMIVAAVAILAAIDEKKLSTAVIALGTITAAVVGILTYLKKLVPTRKKLLNFGKEMVGLLTYAHVIRSMAVSILLFAGAVMIMALAVKMVASVPAANLIKGLATIAALCAGLVYISYILSKQKKKIQQSMMTLLLFAVSIRMLVKPVKQLGALPWDQLAKGMLGITYIAGLMVAVGLLGKKLKKAQDTTKYMLSVAFAMLIAAQALKTIGNLGWNGIAVGMVGMTYVGLLMVGIGLIAKKLKKANDNIKYVTKFSLALLTMALSLRIIGSMSWSALARGALGMSLVIGLLIGVATLLTAAKKTIKLDNLTKLSKQIVILSASMVVLSIGIMAFSAALLSLSIIPFKNMIGPLIALVVVFAALTAAAYFLKGAAPAMLAFGAALALLGIGIFFVAAGLALIVASIDLFVASVSALATALGTFIVELIKVLVTSAVQIVQIVLQAITQILQLLVTMTPQIVAAAITIIIEVLQGLTEILPTVVTFLFDFLTLCLEKFFEFIPDVVKVVFKFILALLEALRDHMWDIANYLLDSLFILLDALLARSSEITEYVWKIILAVLDSLFDLVDKKLPTLINRVMDIIIAFIKRVGEGFRDNAKRFASTYIEFGKNIIKGLWNGIVAALGEMLGNIPFIGGAIKDALQNTLQIHSPSKMTEEMGVFLDKGLASGLNKGTKYVVNATEDFGNDVTKGMSNAISKVAEVVESEMDDELTIRPVMDLSEIQNGTNRMSSMIHNIDGYSLSGTAEIAGKTYKSMNTSRRATINGNDSSSSNSSAKAGNNTEIHNTFNITGENPEEIAEKVSEIMQSQIERKRVAWGR